MNYLLSEETTYLPMLIIDLFHAFIFVQMDVYNVDDIELIQKLIGRLVAANELKALRVLLKNNPYCIHLKPKELNKQFKINGYKFTKRKDRLILIVDKKKLISDKCTDMLNQMVATIE